MGTHAKYLVSGNGGGGGGTVTSVTATAPITSTGGAAPVIGVTGSSLTEATSSVLTITGGSASQLAATTIQVKLATTSVSGYLSNTDWNTFNNKQPAGTYVTAVSIASANGFTGSSSGGATPALTLATSITGLLKGNGTAISAAASGTDYSAGTSGLSTGILKSTTTSGALSIAIAADFPTLNQSTSGSAASVSGTNVITNSNLAQMAANTIKGNNTAGTANALDLTVAQTNTLLGTITSLTTDVVAAGPGAAAATIQANVVTNAKAAQMATNTIKGNNTGGTANALDLTTTQVRAMLNTAPTIQKFTSSSGTYTTPANVLYLKITMVGGGGGGGGSGTTGAGAGGTGGNTTFGTTLLVANGGVGGNVTAGGAGGTASLGTGPIGIALSGSAGSGIPGVPNSSTYGGAGGAGGVSQLAGAGAPVYSAAGGAAVANSGSGGAGGGVANTLADVPGGGGGAGGYVNAIITSPSATYAYAVGAAGTAGTVGTSGFVGGAGALGVIVVEEHYQ